MELTLTDTRVAPPPAPLLHEPNSGIAPLPHRELLHIMALARESDRREGLLLRQGKGWFQVSGTGHEAIAAIAYAMRDDDYLFPYYRDRAIAMARGVRLYDIALGYLAKAQSSSAGRQMPSHFGDTVRGIFPAATPTAAQCIPASGAAWGLKLGGSDRVVVVTTGDASTREGEFYEAYAFALQEKLPVVFVVEDNRYGISTATEGMTPFRIGALSSKDLVELNGRDPDSIYGAAVIAIAKARQGGGPTILWCQIDRLCSHTSSDDQRLYRGADDLTADMLRDPLDLFVKQLIDSGKMSQSDWDAEFAAIQAVVDAEYRRADTAAEPAVSSVTDNVLAATPPSPPPLLVEIDAQSSMVTAINATLAAAIEVNPKVILFGEDIADPKGGVFGLTKGLSTRFPGHVFNAPLAEATIIGVGVGLAATGYRPVFEIQFIDFISPGLNQLMQQAATLRYRSNGSWTCPLTLIAPYGAYLPGGGLWHSESNEGIWAHIHGLNVVIPSTPEDAAGLLWTVIHGDDPTLFLMPKHIFRKRPAPGAGATEAIPLGKAAIRKSGWDVTLVTWGNCTELAGEAIQRIEADGKITVEMIDLRSICPCDYETIAQSLSKTGRLVVVHEDSRTTGFGQSIISEIVGRPEWFNYLYSAPQLVARKDVHIGFNPVLEYAALPSVEEIVGAVDLVLE